MTFKTRCTKNGYASFGGEENEQKDIPDMAPSHCSFRGRKRPPKMGKRAHVSFRALFFPRFLSPSLSRALPFPYQTPACTSGGVLYARSMYADKMKSWIPNNPKTVWPVSFQGASQKSEEKSNISRRIPWDACFHSFPSLFLRKANTFPIFLRIPPYFLTTSLPVSGPPGNTFCHVTQRPFLL